MTPAGGTPTLTTPPRPAPPAGTLAELARRHGLTPAVRRPTPAEYARQLWQRRHFTVAYARARLTALYATARLGQVWHLLTPLFNVGVYWLVFGVLLDKKAGTGGNYIAFLSVGVFVFTYSRESIATGTWSISNRLELIRAVRFPRACLPIAATLVQLQQLVLSMGIVVAIVLATGEPFTWRWLLLIPALTAQTLFNLGCAMLMARVGARNHDIGELVPFLLRTWMYTCGVFYSIAKVTAHAPHLVRLCLEANPGAVYIELARHALLGSYGRLTPHAWPLAAGWALLALVAGAAACWQAEDRYGRG
ncbi:MULTISPECIES: ABC transporter permease [Streptomycetaceae]|uniref:Putative polysaccharide transport system transmembrane component n=1 Tax=Streptantibioticus cattleyicolor (strain ATCC 35852 / DSM 46488 / JCM 4925 / NBRC 14057 / NRRL 8057) TaxID=1003195 RepID=F8K164_STREN|nr:ABC transporter permease [Streptantibioticus cattleyicolor]AEW96135.1 putative polysaccharide transport system transmembrane component [Streptantibioticus cattleyicolor NRRL 8057 = DSM 46488]MYS60663.1 ABC transporter permease [Streptomyces sp. SID5468]CCB76473.1 putative ABC transporter permease protein [Streptantibioticus cattleyicolor NRRL 8057 = DSM 46488]